MASYMASTRDVPVAQGVAVGRVVGSVVAVLEVAVGWVGSVVAVLEVAVGWVGSVAVLEVAVGWVGSVVAVLEVAVGWVGSVVAVLEVAVGWVGSVVAVLGVVAGRAAGRVSQGGSTQHLADASLQCLLSLSLFLLHVLASSSPSSSSPSGLRPLYRGICTYTN